MKLLLLSIFGLILLTQGAMYSSTNEKLARDWMKINRPDLLPIEHVTRDDPPTHLPNPMIGQDQLTDVPVVGATTLWSKYPNKHFGSDPLIASKGRKDQRRILLKIDNSGFVPGVDEPWEATLRLATVDGRNNPPGWFTVHGVTIREDLDSSTWNCEIDTKLTEIDVNGDVFSNAIDECDNNIRWRGTAYQDADPGVASRVQRGKHGDPDTLELDVTQILFDGYNGILVKYETEGGPPQKMQDFKGLGSDDPPTVTILTPGLEDNVDGWPQNQGCENVIRTVVSPVSGLPLSAHAYYCRSTSHAGRQKNCLITTGVGWNAALTYRQAQAAKSGLRDDCNLWFPNLMCSGREGEFTECPRNKTAAYPNGFGYGFDQEEADWYEKWWFDDVHGLFPAGERIHSYITWDRASPIVTLLMQSRQDKWFGGLEADSWFRAFPCSDANAALPPGVPGHCNQFGFFIESCFAWDPVNNVCLFSLPPSPIIACVSNNQACSDCLLQTDPVSGWKTVWWNNDTRMNQVLNTGYVGLEDPLAQQARQNCYDLDNLGNVEQFGFQAFTPTNGFGSFYPLTDKEARAQSEFMLNQPDSSLNNIGRFHYPYGIAQQGPLNGTFIQPLGRTEKDTISGALFTTATNDAYKVKGKAVMVLQPDGPSGLGTFTGGWLIGLKDEALIKSDAYPTASVKYVPNDSGHAITHVAPFLVAKKMRRYLKETQPQVEAEELGLF